MRRRRSTIFDSKLMEDEVLGRELTLLLAAQYDLRRRRRRKRRRRRRITQDFASVAITR